MDGKLIEHGGSIANGPRPCCLAEVFRKTVAAHPEQIAIVDLGQNWTYRQIEQAADAFSRRLLTLGIRRGDRVGLWAGRSAECLTAMLGILKAGAAYVPLDAEFPQQRVTDVLADCEAKAIVADAPLAARLTELQIPVVQLENVLKQPPSAESLLPPAADLDDLAYIIYTSGTTGKSKGVPITHRNIWHLVEAEVELFQIQPTDRVFHGFSIAFDASLEEIWLAFRSGATLVVGSADEVRSGPQLAEFLTEKRVTVLSCVPTLLTMIDRDCPTVQLLILGGEACSPEIVRRWSRPNRRMVNTYGPTEATVVATWSDLIPDAPVRIGRAIRGWTTYVVDEALNPVAAETPGELLIGGPGVAGGYLNRPELTAQKFVQLPWASERLYRTGDLVQLDADGQLEFLDRIDEQVKLRGFRIELGEIEAGLLSFVGVAASAATVHRDPAGDLLAGYVTLRPGATFDEAACRQKLRQKLPPYMIPGVFTVLETLPTLSSGKLDRKSLPRPSRPVVGTATAPPHLTPTETAVWNYWQTLFPGEEFDREDNFFDLGGQSLLATRLVSEMRRESQWANLSVTDLYRSPTLAQLAQRLDEITVHTTSQPRAARAAPPGSRRLRHFLCGCAQFFAIYLLLVCTLPYWIPIFVIWNRLVEKNHEHQLFIAIMLATSMLYLLLPMQLALVLIIKWLVIGRCKPGRYPLWGMYYLRFWFVQQVTRLFPTSHLRGMPWLNLYFRLMGAHIGRNVHLATDEFVAFDLLTIGDDTSLGHDARLCTATVEDGWLILGKIHLGARCRVGSRAWIGQGSQMQDDAELYDGTMLPPDSVVGAGEHWHGSPARKVTAGGASEFAWPEEPAPPAKSPLQLQFIYGVGVIGLSLFPTLAALPGAFLLGYVDTHYCDFTENYHDAWKMALTLPIATTLHLVVQTLLIAAAKWVLIGRVKPGVYSTHSFWYVRKWLVDALMHLSLDLLYPMYGTLYLNPWIRLLGAKLGKNVEVSTVEGWNPDLVELEEGVFVADAVSLGPAEIRRGWCLNLPVRVGKNSFLGNSAIVPGGTILGEKTLIGVLSKSPDDPQDAARVDGSWLGNPAIHLPHREINTDFKSKYTYAPSTKLRALRLLIEFFRVVTPGTIVVFTVFMAFQFGSDLLHRHHFNGDDEISAEPATEVDGSLGEGEEPLMSSDDYAIDLEFLLVFPLLIGAAGLACLGFTIALKWLVVGRYRPQERPLWSTFVWRSEFVNCLHEHLSMPMFGVFILGTPFMSYYFWLLGTKVGRRCFFDSANLTEFDLVILGDDAALNSDCDPQTHLFEDRVMKMSYVKIGEGCTIGSRAVILYDAELTDHTNVLGNSLVMKGEQLPPRSSWLGSPAQRADDGT